MLPPVTRARNQLEMSDRSAWSIAAELAERGSFEDKDKVLVTNKSHARCRLSAAKSSHGRPVASN